MSVEQQLEWVRKDIKELEKNIEKKVAGIEVKVNLLLLKEAKVSGGAIVASIFITAIFQIALIIMKGS